MFYKLFILTAFSISVHLNGVDFLARAAETHGSSREGESPSLHQQEYKANHPYHPNEGQNAVKQHDVQEGINAHDNQDNVPSTTVVPVQSNTVTPTTVPDSANSQGYHFLNDYND